MQGRGRLEESKLGAEMAWAARRFSSLEAKELGE